MLYSPYLETFIDLAASKLCWRDATYVFESTTILISKLQSLWDAKSINQKCSTTKLPSYFGLEDEKFVANLLYILHRLQTFVFLTLIQKTQRDIDQTTTQKFDYSSDRFDDRDCRKEWPGGQRHVSTTWPWTIKPSLAVLWVLRLLKYKLYEADSVTGSLLDVLLPSSTTRSTGIVETWQRLRSKLTFLHRGMD